MKHVSLVMGDLNIKNVIIGICEGKVFFRKLFVHIQYNSSVANWHR